MQMKNVQEQIQDKLVNQNHALGAQTNRYVLVEKQTRKIQH